ncbi:uncharacterized protein [Ptychodera flava]|uniref:uncharacterized protein isoform X1 n=1 Tax=Ptychodera flava TaxID=63121 RepID=UPI00396A6051
MTLMTAFHLVALLVLLSRCAEATTPHLNMADISTSTVVMATSRGSRAANTTTPGTFSSNSTLVINYDNTTSSQQLNVEYENSSSTNFRTIFQDASNFTSRQNTTSLPELMPTTIKPETTLMHNETNTSASMSTSLPSIVTKKPTLSTTKNNGDSSMPENSTIGMISTNNPKHSLNTADTSSRLEDNITGPSLNPNTSSMSITIPMATANASQSATAVSQQPSHLTVQSVTPSVSHPTTESLQTKTIQQQTPRQTTRRTLTRIFTNSVSKRFSTEPGLTVTETMATSSVMRSTVDSSSTVLSHASTEAEPSSIPTSPRHTTKANIPPIQTSSTYRSTSEPSDITTVETRFSTIGSTVTSSPMPVLTTFTYIATAKPATTVLQRHSFTPTGTPSRDRDRSTTFWPTTQSVTTIPQLLRTTPKSLSISTSSALGSTSRTASPSPKTGNLKIDINQVFISGQKWTGVYSFDNEEVPFYMDILGNRDDAVITARINDGKVQITMSGQYEEVSSTLTFYAQQVNSEYPVPRFDKDIWSMLGTVSINHPGYLYSGHMTGEGFGNFHAQPGESGMEISDKFPPTEESISSDGRLPVSVYIVIGVLVPVVIVMCVLTGMYFYRAKKRGSFHLHTSLLSFSNPLYDGESHSGLSTGPL